MKIYNTMTRKKEEFTPIQEGEVGIYICGPTVYNLIHIGNARPMCVFDALRRYFIYRGYKVKYVQNFTDVDDKIIKRANEEGVTPTEISEKYINEFKIDEKGLNVLPADLTPKVTENIESIIGIIADLVEKGVAYEVEGDVYFSAEKFPEYGKLSKMELEELQEGARISVNDNKRAAADFALWKAAKPDEPSWESPWGNGRPGWHIECSAMSRKFLGDTIDIHGGGQDLIFPHHENEIAQSECATNQPLANYWMHNGHINVDNRKMSKSKGNFFTVRDVADKYGYEPIRFLMLQSAYRSPINYSIDVIESCVSALERLYNCLDSMNRMLETAPEGEATPEFMDLLSSRRVQFIEAMDDDLNTADAVAAIFELVRDINTMLFKSDEANKGQVQSALDLFLELNDVLGLLYNKADDDEIPANIQELAIKRQQARENKDYATADAIRDEITALGFIIEETKQGTKISKR